MPSCAPQDVRFGSKADIGGRLGNVCFTPKSGHWDSAQSAAKLAPHARPVTLISIVRSAAGHYVCSGKRKAGATEESPMVFEHPSVNRSWVTYEIGKDRSIAAILHVEPNKPVQGDRVESELTDAIVEFIRSRGDIDRAEVLPRNIN